jgi:hypothetical protein
VEATGGYQRGVVLGSCEVELPVSVVNPARVRQYVRANGLLYAVLATYLLSETRS